ncbi:MAG: T9SS type A sorting domain-containing protein [Bacteroidetes bacterium]|nr:MAG: T9SS type A sorting domain-containing protein [Bacteroidota bacterium]
MSPNPASSAVNIHLHGQSNDAHLYIHDQLGRMVWNQAVSVEEGSFNLPLQDYRFGNGVYLVTLVSNGDRITRRLVISK